MDEILQELRLEARGIVNTTKHFLTLTEGYMDAGDEIHARACLILLCENCSNYEESIEFNDLQDTWEKYRHLVDGLVPPSVRFNTISACNLAECTMRIGDIFALADDDLLSALSEHLNQLSGYGDAVNRLNKWEKVAFYADELWSEVNSGGFFGYLYYYGTHFKKAYQALEEMHADAIVQMLHQIEQKFPKARIPKREEAIQNVLDCMEDMGVDFEEYDDWFYAEGEKELRQCMLSYLQENQSRFR